jgi:signal transduction histidine kinase
LENPPKVLIIDDEEAARYGIRRALGNQGYELDEAGDGVAALARLDTYQPDVIISDINMPGMDGLTLLRHLNRRKEPPLVVLITAYGSEAVAAEALRAGAYDYLAKPFDVEALRAAVRNAVDQQRLRRELRQSQAALAHAEKMASLGRLVAGVAHEINTPLGVLQSNTNTMARAAGKLAASLAEHAEARRYLELITSTAGLAGQACERISQIVGNLKLFARLDEAEIQQARLHEGLESTLTLLGPQIGADIEIERAFGELPEVSCAPRQLNQVWLHLLLNAVEAIRRAGRKGTIRVETRVEDGAAKVAIEDNGCGIPPENLDRIFDPGFTTKGVKVGTGLGLPICFQVVREHGGRIEVESRPNGGARFTVVLPLEA